VNFLSRWSRRGAVLALGVGVLLSVAPAVPARASETEPTASETAPSDVTTLVLEPVCAIDGLHRFAVNSVAGPGTQFTVAVAGSDGKTMAIEAGQTRHFWVEQQAGPVQIVWDGGSASATGVDEACGPDAVPSDVLIEPLPSATDAPAPDRPASTPSRPPASEPAAPSTATEQPATGPPAERRNGDGASRPATSPRAADAPQGVTPPGRDTRAEPRPRRFDGTMVCPDGWIPVDSDADGRFEASDSCEVLVETAAQASAVGVTFPTIALIVTVGLLVASIGLGAFGRQRT
jgi:hypothetical protein